MSALDEQLDRLRTAHQAKARYSIYRHRLAEDGYARVNEPLEHAGLTWCEVNTICDGLNKEAREAAGNPSDSWGLTQYFPKLETPVPPRWTPVATAELMK